MRLRGKPTGKIVFFSESQTLNEVAGKINSMEDIKNEGVIHLEPAASIRIDRIVGRPAAAYDENNAYASGCMDCMGGYDKDQLEQM